MPFIYAKHLYTLCADKEKAFIAVCWEKGEAERKEEPPQLPLMAKESWPQKQSGLISVDP